MILLKRYFENQHTIVNEIMQFKNSKLDLSGIQNQMFQKILKKSIVKDAKDRLAAKDLLNILQVT